MYWEPHFKTTHHDFIMVYELYQLLYIMGIDLGSHHTSYIIIPCHTYGYILGSLWNIVKVWANVPCKEHLGASGDDETAMNVQMESNPLENGISGTQAMQFNTTMLLIYQSIQLQWNHIESTGTSECGERHVVATVWRNMLEWLVKFWDRNHSHFGQFPQFPRFKLPNGTQIRNVEIIWDFRMGTNGHGFLFTWLLDAFSIF